MFDKKKLENDKEVTEYDIKNKATVVLVKDESVSMSEDDYVAKEESPKLIVWDKTEDPPKEIVISLSPEDKLEDMKEKISGLNELSPESQTLIFNEDKLDDTKPISDIGIKNKSVVQLLPSVTIENKIVVPSEMFDIPFTWKDTVENIKEKICKEKEIPSDKIVLLFNGESLDDVKQVTDYEIKNRSALVLV
jgi:hypothetical protein